MRRSIYKYMYKKMIHTLNQQILSVLYTNKYIHYIHILYRTYESILLSQSMY